MSQKYFAFLLFVAWCSFVTVQSQLLDPLLGKKGNGQKVVNDYRNHEPIRPGPVVTKLAKSLSNGLLHSDVFGERADFQLDHVYGLFFRVGSRLLEAAGFHAPHLAKIAARAGEKVGLVSSELYFDTIGFMLAKFFLSQRVLSHANVDYLSVSVVSSIELVACADGLYDTETVMNAVVYGFLKVLKKFGLINFHNMEQLFYLFAEEIEALAAKY